MKYFCFISHCQQSWLFNQGFSQFKFFSPLSLMSWAHSYFFHPGLFIWNKLVFICKHYALTTLQVGGWTKYASLKCSLAILLGVTVHLLVRNQPITWQQLSAFSHLEVVKTSFWSSNHVGARRVRNSWSILGFSHTTKSQVCRILSETVWMKMSGTCVRSEELERQQ